jgi:Ca2+-binding RTX toxin-like protein
VITLGVGIGNLLQTGAGGSTLLVSSAAIGTDTIQGAMTTNDGTGNQVILATAGTANITGVTGFQTFRLGDGGLNSLTVNDGNFIRLPGKSISVLGGDAGNTVNASTLSAANAVRLIGGLTIDTFIGGAGDDTIDGRGGADVMAGGGGGDTYIVDQIRDRVIEAIGGGTDTILTLSDYTLRAGQEVEFLRAHTGTPSLRLNGNELDNRIFGGTGDDMINGRGGADRMAGGAGDDRYFVDDAGDTIVELSGMGTDIVFSFTPSFILGANVENLTLSDGATSGTGNSLANVIRSFTGADTILAGKAGDDRLIGGDGADTLNGGVGVDVLAGGAGADSFVFLKGEAAGDRITDFVVGTDHIDFYGYDADATFAKVAGAWTVTEGALTEVINFTVFPVTLTAADYHFY